MHVPYVVRASDTRSRSKLCICLIVNDFRLSEFFQRLETSYMMTVPSDQAFKFTPKCYNVVKLYATSGVNG